MRNDVFNNRRYVPVIRYNDPALQAAMLNNQGDYARIFVMINNVFIGHSGLVLDEGEYSFLYDPAGSYTGCKNNKCEGSVKVSEGLVTILNILILIGMITFSTSWMMVRI